MQGREELLEDGCKQDVTFSARKTIVNPSQVIQRADIDQLINSCTLQLPKNISDGMSIELRTMGTYYSEMCNRVG